MMEQKRESQGIDTKGGGQRGAPKRWKGSGPRPARHIPWPEIFKHHISLIEGHLKMTDMVRKHTVEGTGNWRAISEIIDRTKEMLHAAKSTARTFVPPVNHLNQVPLGSSSVSMYPGYSPADHDYGKAAEEYGAFAAAARAQGVDVKHPDLDYEIGQGRGTKRKTLEGIRQATKVKHGGPGSRGAGEAPGGPEPKPTTPYALHLKNQANGKNTAEETVANGDNPFFVIDVDPTPVNLTEPTIKSPKRSASLADNVEEKPKKLKKKHKGNLPQAADSQGVEFEDISQEVDARLKEKEAKRKRKEEKKRKREPADALAAPAEPPVAAEIEQPRKKKSRKSEDNVLVDRSVSKRPQSAEDDEVQGEGKKKKRKKNKDRVEA